MRDDTGPAKLLVKAALEAVLAKSSNRLDASARSERMKAAALMECADKGYAGLTIAGIAKRAKVSTSSIYEEFPDRDALLVAAMEMLFTMLANDVIEVPPVEDPQGRVEQLLIAHGQVYAQPLTVWFFRLHVTLAWAGHVHLREMGQLVFRGIDAFWAKFLGELEAQGHLSGVDPELVVPLLLGPVERCTIIARLSCGEDDPGRPSLAEVARHGAETLFQVWGRGAARPKPSASVEEAARLLAELKPFAVPGAADDQEQAAKLNRNTPREQKASILRAAKTLCRERGYELSNMQDIAESAGVSTATIYGHYADKASLFRSAAEAAFAENGHYRDGNGAIALDSALLSIASRAADPNWVWMHNVLMASSISDDPRIVAIGRKRRDETEAFLAGAIALERDALTLNFLLGAVERSGVLTLILFGTAAVDLSLLSRLAIVTAQSFERGNRIPGAQS